MDCGVLVFLLCCDDNAFQTEPSLTRGIYRLSLGWIRLNLRGLVDLSLVLQEGSTDEAWVKLV